MHPRTYLTERDIPRLRGHPFVGSARAVRADLLAVLLRVQRAYGDLGAFTVGPRLMVMLNAPAYVQTALVEQADQIERAPRLVRLLRPMLGEGLLTVEDAPHRRHRKLIAPAFQQRRIAAYASVMTA